MKFKHGFNNYSTKEALNYNQVIYDLYEGKSIKQFQLTNPTLLTNNILINYTTKSHVIGIRYNSKSSDNRTLIACLLPPNIKCSESIMFEDTNLSYDYKLYILGILNSFVIDFYVKKICSHMHVGNNIISNIPIPPIDNIYYHQITSLVSDIMSYPQEKLRNKLDVLVAKLYNISHEEFNYILSTFKIKHNEYSNLINQF